MNLENTKQVKSVLAKLLATENLTVEFAQVETASFDVKNRVLMLPQLKELDQEILDLFVGHEVAHALWTPQDGIEQLKDKGKDFFSFVNVVEDARIERLIQKKYPGLKKPFYAGYQKLKSADFFNLAETNVNEMLLIDRINLKAKLGTQIDIEFTEEEQVFFDRSMQTYTWREVVELAEELFAYCQKEMEEKKEQNVQAMQDYMVGESSDDFEESDEASDDIDTALGNKPEKNQTAPAQGEEDDSEEEAENEAVAEADGEKTDDNGEESETKSEEKGDAEVQRGEYEGSAYEEEGSIGPKSLTDRAKERNTGSLIEDDESKMISYIDIPQRIDVEKIIVPFKETKKALYTYWSVLEKTDKMTTMTKLGKDFRKGNEKVVSYIHKEFEMKKAADRYARASQSKTGVINTNKLFSYKYNDDLFLKKTVLPNGKDHGMVMFIDWSGSMAENLKGTMEQLLNLAMFCKKSNIPFAAYAFSSEYGKTDDVSGVQSTNINEANVSNLRLIEMFHEKMTTTEFNKAIEIWLVVAEQFTRFNEFTYWGLPRQFYLGGTPLDEAIVVATRLVKEFQTRNRVQIMNTVFLTDGCSHRINGVFHPKAYRYGGTTEQPFYQRSPKIIRDKVTHTEVRVPDHQGKNMTKGLYEMLKKSTGTNLVGFFVANTRDIRHAFNQYIMKEFDADNYWFRVKEFKKQFNKEKGYIVTDAGLDELYIIKGGKALEVKDEGLQVAENATKGQLTSAFKKMTKGKLQNRVILGKFVEKIAA